MNKKLENQQKIVCLKHNADYCLSPSYLKVGIASNVREGLRPINGFRHLAEGDATGWYIWAGENLSNSPDFFQPLHVEHLSEWCPEIQKFLGLPPGWRFLIDGEYEDVWYDESLLELR